MGPRMSHTLVKAAKIIFAFALAAVAVALLTSTPVWLFEWSDSAPTISDSEDRRHLARLDRIARNNVEDIEAKLQRLADIDAKLPRQDPSGSPSTDIPIGQKTSSKIPDSPQRRRLRPVAEIDLAAMVRAVAKPAQVNFQIDTKMRLGQVYEARLEIVRPDTVRKLSEAANTVISEQVTILDKVRTSLESAHLNVTALSERWQDISLGNRAMWIWRVEPTHVGKATLVVSVVHAGTFRGEEREWSVEHFPNIIDIEVGWWQGVKIAVAGFAPIAQTSAAILSASSVLCGGIYAVLVWWRKRRHPEPARADEISQ
jgi:hypothetical protein